MINRLGRYALGLVIVLIAGESSAQIHNILENNAFLIKQRFEQKKQLQTTKPTGKYYINLQSFDSIHFERFEFSNQKMPTEEQKNQYQYMFHELGIAADNPQFVIYAEWKIENPQLENAFLQSRKELFALRKRHLSSFSFDVLFKNLKHDGRYLILGFYQDRKGLVDARSNPKITKWAKDHPPSNFTAKDLFRPPVYQIIDDSYFVNSSIMTKWMEIGGESHPKLTKHCRYRPLIGGNYQDWKGISRDDMLMGLLELDSGITYPDHRHPTPEIYYILQGSARWWVNGKAMQVEPGHTIFHPPHAIHRMVNMGPETLRAIYFWWAPFGDRTHFDGYEFVE